jgi:hypothetical protein
MSTAISAALPDGRPLVAEGGRALLGVGAPVDRRPDPLGLRVGLGQRQLGDQPDGRLGRAHRQRRVRRDPGGQRLRGGPQPGQGHDLVDQPDLAGAVRVDRVAGEQQLHGHPRGHQPGQRRRPRRAAADLHLGDGEPGGVGGDHEVALLGEQEAAGVGDAVHRGDRRLVDDDVAAELRQEVRRRHGQRALGHLA